MPALARKTPLKLLPAIATAARLRARQVNLPLSTYVTLLLWNRAQGGARALAPEPASRQLARLHVPCTIRRAVWLLIQPQIAASRLSANAYIEAVIAAELRTPDAALLVLPARGTAKPQIK